MQLKIRHTLSEELALPLSYHHIIQSIIYRGLADESGYSRHMHNSGYAANNVNNVGRRYKLFNFSLLRGNSRVMNRQIIFRDYVEWEIRSPDIYMMRLLESLYEATNASQGNQRCLVAAVDCNWGDCHNRCNCQYHCDCSGPWVEWDAAMAV